MLDSKKSLVPRQSSNREFGLVMAAFFLLLSIVSARKHGGLPALYLPALSAGFAFFAFALPRALAPLNLAWSAVGYLLHRVMSPVILGVLYFLVITPFGVAFRAIKKDPLRLRLDPAAESYWIKREEQPGKGMTNQF